MSEEEIINRIIAVNPSDVVYSITMRNILTALVQRMGMQALALTLFVKRKDGEGCRE